MKKNKAPGEDGIPVDFYQLGLPLTQKTKSGDDPPPMTPMAFATYALTRVTVALGHIPKCDSVGVVCALYKKGDPTRMNNYRGITMLNAPKRICTEIMSQRFRTQVEQMKGFIDNQGGFRKGEETNAQVITLREVLLRRRFFSKRGLRTYLIFLDFAKAFDTVGQVPLSRKAYEMGARGMAFRYILSLYRNPQIAVRISGGISALKEYVRGELQGCGFSPDLFDTYINDFFDMMDDLGMGVQVPGFGVEMKENGCEDQLGDSYIPLLDEDEDLRLLDLVTGFLFADDSNLLAATKPMLVRALEAADTWAKKWGMTFGIAKCGVMCVPAVGDEIFNRTYTERGEDGVDVEYTSAWSAEMQDLVDHPLILRGEPVPVTTEYEYLGFMFHFTTSLVPAMIHTMKRVEKRRKQWDSFLAYKTVPFDIRVRCLLACVMSVATFGGELLGAACRDPSLTGFKHDDDGEILRYKNGRPKPGCKLLHESGANLDDIETAMTKIQTQVDIGVVTLYKGRRGNSSHLMYGTTLPRANIDINALSVRSIMSGLRVRAYIKYPGAKTLAKKLFTKVNDSDFTKVQQRQLWTYRTEEWLSQLRERRLKDTDVNRIAHWGAKCNPGLFCSPRTENRLALQGCNPTDCKQIGRIVKRLANAVVISDLKSKTNPTKTLTAYCDGELFQSIRCLGVRTWWEHSDIAYGIHWLHRIRAGAFILQRQAKDMPHARCNNSDSCPCCDGGEMDTIPHFIVTCTRFKSLRRKGKGFPLSKFKDEIQTLIFDSIASTTTAVLVKRVVRHCMRPYNLLMLMLGGSVSKMMGHTNVSDLLPLHIMGMYELVHPAVANGEILTPKEKADAVRAKQNAVIRYQLGVATFLNGAMGIRNKCLWKSKNAVETDLDLGDLGQS
eukprot:m.148452 g.148452  ORF g.148452 m.148452 type:complete len:893 (+) comp30598_c0_seq1:2818-5496(+)